LSREDKVGCELYIPGSKELFFQLCQQKSAIEKDLGLEGKIEWQELPQRKASRIRTFASFDFDDEKTWEQAFQWLAEQCAKFKKTFAKNWGKPVEVTNVPSN
jgi:4-alpha-glucanotransferase